MTTRRTALPELGLVGVAGPRRSQLRRRDVPGVDRICAKEGKSDHNMTKVLDRTYSVKPLGSGGLRMARYAAEVVVWSVVWSIAACWLVTGIAVWHGLT